MKANVAMFRGMDSVAKIQNRWISWLDSKFMENKKNRNFGLRFSIRKRFRKNNFLLLVVAKKFIYGLVSETMSLKSLGKPDKNSVFKSNK